MEFNNPCSSAEGRRCTKPNDVVSNLVEWLRLNSVKDVDGGAVKVTVAHVSPRAREKEKRQRGDQPDFHDRKLPRLLRIAAAWVEARAVSR